MADISGTVLVNGATPTDYVYVDAYDLTDPEYGYEPAGILDYAEDATVSQVDGSYTITGLPAGHDYALIAGNVVDTALPEFVNGATNWGDSHAVSAPSAGVNFNCDPYSAGTMFSATSVNCPDETVMVIAYVIDPDIGIAESMAWGAPNAALHGLWHNLHAAEDYRIFYTALDSSWETIANLWYPKLHESKGNLAGTVLGNATGIVLDFAGTYSSRRHFTVKPGAGRHFSTPSSTKSRLLK